MYLSFNIEKFLKIFRMKKKQGPNIIGALLCITKLKYLCEKNVSVGEATNLRKGTLAWIPFIGNQYPVNEMLPLF
jgi:hypothetical protein